MLQIEGRPDESSYHHVVASAADTADRTATLHAKSAELGAVVLRSGTGAVASVVYELGGDRCAAFAQAVRDSPTTVVGSDVMMIEKRESLQRRDFSRFPFLIEGADCLGGSICTSGRIVAYVPDAAEHVVSTRRAGYGGFGDQLRQIDLTKMQVQRNGVDR